MSENINVSKALDAVMQDCPDILTVWTHENTGGETSNRENPSSFEFQVDQIFREIRIYTRQPARVVYEGDPTKGDVVSFSTQGEVRQLESFAYAYYLLQEKYGRDYRFVIGPLVEEGNKLEFTLSWMQVSPVLQNRGTSFDGPEKDPIVINRADPLGVHKLINMESTLVKVARRLRKEAAKRATSKTPLRAR